MKQHIIKCNSCILKVKVATGNLNVKKYPWEIIWIKLSQKLKNMHVKAQSPLPLSALYGLNRVCAHDVMKFSNPKLKSKGFILTSHN